MMLIHNICIAFSGLGSFRNVDIVMSEMAAMLLNNKGQSKQVSQDSRCSTTQDLWKGKWSFFCLTHVLNWKRTKLRML